MCGTGFASIIHTYYRGQGGHQGRDERKGYVGKISSSLIIIEYLYMYMYIHNMPFAVGAQPMP